MKISEDFYPLNAHFIYSKKIFLQLLCLEIVTNNFTDDSLFKYKKKLKGDFLIHLVMNSLCEMRPNGTLGQMKLAITVNNSWV